VFQRIKAILTAIRDGLRRIYGPDVTAEQVFAAIEAGEYADVADNVGDATDVVSRETADGETQDAKYRRIPALTVGPDTTIAEIMQELEAEAAGILRSPDVGHAVDLARIKLQDRMLRVKRLEKAAEIKLGRPLNDNERAYLAEEGMHSKIAEKQSRLHWDFKVPILDLMKAGKLTMEQVDEFLYAKHAEARNAYIAGINDKFPDGGSGMTNAEARKILAKSTPELEQIADIVRQMMTRRLDEMVESGLVSAEQAASWRRDFGPDYVPLRGLEDDPAAEEMRPLVGRGLMGRRKIEPHATGRGSKAQNVLATAWALSDEAIIRGEKNFVAQTLGRLAEQVRDPSVWELDPSETKARLVKGKIQYVKNPHYSPKDTITYRVAGKEKRLQINDPLLLNAISNVGVGGGPILNAMMNINGVLSKLNTTWNPEFALTNPIMDAQTGLINLGAQDMPGLRKDVTKNWKAAFKGALHYEKTGKADTEWSKLAAEWRREGGATAFNQLKDIAAQKKSIDSAMKDFQGNSPLAAARGIIALRDTVERWNNSADAAIRLSTYAALRKRGMSAPKAASVAKNLTVNFNRRGEWGPMANGAYLFFNASVQGTAVMLTAMKHPKVRKMVAGIAALGAVQEIVGSLFDDDDDEDKLGLSAYDRIPEHVKTRNIILMYGSKDGEYIPIRMPYGYNFFHSLGRLAVAYGRGAKELTGKPVSLAQTLSKTGSAFMDAIAPTGLSSSNPLVPSLLLPFQEARMNEDFAGRAISPEKMPGDTRPDSQLFYGRTNALMKETAAFLNRMTGGDEFEPGLVDVSPESIEHVISAHSGAALRTAWNIANRAYAWTKEQTGNNPEDPQFGVSDVPFLRRVKGSASPYQEKDATYRRITELEILDDRMKAASTDMDKARAIMAEHRAELGMIKPARKLRSSLADLRKQRTAVLADERLSAAEQRARTDKIAETELRLMRQFNEHYVRALN
jgi:hypothetical protein